MRSVCWLTTRLIWRTVVRVSLVVYPFLLLLLEWILLRWQHHRVRIARIAFGLRWPIFLTDWSAIWWMRRRPEHQLTTHQHVMGLSGMGKSRYIEQFVYELIRNGISCTFIDPMGVSVRRIISRLTADGFFERQGYDRLALLDLQDQGWYLPLNYIGPERQSQVDAEVLASDFNDVAHRVWPELNTGSPQFDSLVRAGVRILIANQLPLTMLMKVLTDKVYRTRLLTKVTDYGPREYFEEFEKLSSARQVEFRASVIRRLEMLTHYRVLANSLGQTWCGWDPLANKRNNVSTLISLAGIKHDDPKAIMGSLLMQMVERSAFLEADIDEKDRKAHFLVVDEFSIFSTKSADLLSRMLSLVRQFNLHCLLSHQEWGQNSRQLQGALQNCQVKVLFRLGPMDAETMAKWIAPINFYDVKSDPLTTVQQPVWFPTADQYEAMRIRLRTLDIQHAILARGRRDPIEVIIQHVPEPQIDPEEVESVYRYYRDRYMTRADQLHLPHLGDEPPRRESINDDDDADGDGE